MIADRAWRPALLRKGKDVADLLEAVLAGKEVAVAGDVPRAWRAVDLVNAAALRAKIEDAKGRLSTAANVMERALLRIEHAAREDKSMISGALGTALAEVKARQDLLALEQVIAEA